MRRRHIFGIVAASALVAGITSYGVSSVAASRGQITAPYQVEFASTGTGAHFTSFSSEAYPDLTYAAENAVKAVVNIEKTEEVKTTGYTHPFFEFFGIPSESEGTPRERRSGGSGVIISSDGYIVTNNHVIENASKIKVKLNDNRFYDAKLIGTDPTTDVALIKIEATGLPTLAFGNSDELRLGEWVLAIGSPFDLQSTVTAGIVSAKARNLSVIPGQFSIESFIQTDAAVNPGNSGGALVNTKGELVGINTVIKSPTGSFAGYSFAVPSSIVQKVVIDLKEYGLVQRAMMGVTYNFIDAQFLENAGKQYGITEPGGIYVVGVSPDGGAAEAGIKEGDIITEINGVKIDASSTLQEQIAKHRPNDKVKITAKRGNSVKQFDVTLRNSAGKTELLKRGHSDAIEALGGTFAEVSEDAKKNLKIDGGVVVISIKDGGVLSKARVRKNYIITHINDKAVSSVSDLARITDKITSIDGVYPDGRSVSYSLWNGSDE